ncbi:hypothetical protein LCL89_02480 [Halobacillus yeomjeoni]|uniref:ATP synthase F(0) sector subunit c n=1 Tax=Halobacillus yeomjeoni TaxID=311194 RepID=A0A931HTZ0_9BACI|nr:hypothetical protein [Halobacillus yeomjeoni]MBH0229700.1 hypothetical protein [Halobacillus yeomjeoni]MCA0982907.1 hypothetical protein [Halobacillus yeomjeoni]
MRGLQNYSFCAALLILGLAGIGIGIGISGGRAIEAVGRQPFIGGELTQFYVQYILLPEFLLALVLVSFAVYFLLKDVWNKDE